MSAPVGRDTPARRAAEQRAKTRSLAERPAPPPAEAVAGAPEWAQYTVDNVSLGTSFTTIPWTLNNFAYDEDVPTFDLDGSGNLIVGKAGSYRMGIQARGWSFVSSVNTVLWLRVEKISGASLRTAMDAINAANGETSSEILRYDSQNANEFDFETLLIPSRDFDFILTQASLDGGGPSTIRVRAYVEEDLSGVAHGEPDWRMMVVRAGAVMEEP